MKIAISAESTIDLPKHLLGKYQIHTIPFLISLGDKTACDGEITPQEIFDFVAKTGVLPKTSAINAYQYEQYFQSILDQGYDAIIHFCLSSKISCSYQNALIASKNFDNVHVIDSLNLSTGIALQAIYARQLSEQNLNVDLIVKKVEERKDKVQSSFVLAKLDYLHKGGRCSGLTHLGATILGIRPKISVIDGAMGPTKKYRGKDQIVVKKYCEDTLNESANIDKSICFITITNYSPEISELAKEVCLKAGFKDVYITTAGATITSHCGDRTLGIFYYEN